MTQGAIDKGRLWRVLIPILLLFAGAILYFAPQQNVWNDETTQLSGATLTPGPLLAWLAGQLQIPFGVPPDRMPPVSYFIDMVGWRIWGDNVLAFRLLHALITAGGLVTLLAAMARHLSLRAALIGGLFLALSPKLIETAVEIRAYPIFFAISCVQLAILLRGDVAARPLRLAAFFGLGLLSAYTHFFGVVATSAYAIAIFIAAPDLKAAIRVMAGQILFTLLCAGLAPFVLGANAISPSGPSAVSDSSDIVSFLLLALTNSSIMIHPLIAVVFFGAIAVLILIGAAGMAGLVARQGIAARRNVVLSLALGLTAGLLVTIVAGLAFHGFNALSPRYSIWVLPTVAVVIAAVADGLPGSRGRLVNGLRYGAVGLLALGAVAAQATFLRNASWFIHGPSETVERLIAQAQPPLAIVHVGPSWNWAFFPAYWRHRDAIPHWLLTPDGQSVIPITRGGDISGAPQPLAALTRYRALLVARTELKSYTDLRAVGAGTAPPPFVDELAPPLAQAGWRPGKSVYWPGNYAFTGQLYDKAKTVGPSGPRPTNESE